MTDKENQIKIAYDALVAWQQSKYKSLMLRNAEKRKQSEEMHKLISSKCGKEFRQSSDRLRGYEEEFAQSSKRADQARAFWFAARANPNCKTCKGKGRVKTRAAFNHFMDDCKCLAPLPKDKK